MFSSKFTGDSTFSEMDEERPPEPIPFLDKQLQYIMNLAQQWGHKAHSRKFTAAEKALHRDFPCIHSPSPGRIGLIREPNLSPPPSWSEEEMQSIELLEELMKFSEGHEVGMTQKGFSFKKWLAHMGSNFQKAKGFGKCLSQRQVLSALCKSLWPESHAEVLDYKPLVPGDCATPAEVKDHLLIKDDLEDLLAIKTVTGWRFVAGLPWKLAKQKWKNVSKSEHVHKILEEGWSGCKTLQLDPAWFESHVLSEQAQAH